MTVVYSGSGIRLHKMYFFSDSKLIFNFVGFVEMVLVCDSGFIQMNIRYSLEQPFFTTEEFYGTTIPDVELVICDVSQPTYPRTLFGNLTPPYEHFWNVELKTNGSLYHWSLRHVEELKTKRDYEVLVSSCTYVNFENLTVRLPIVITSLIGEFCTPIISSGHIVLLSSYDSFNI